jgi:hypothetical protein
MKRKTTLVYYIPVRIPAKQILIGIYAYSMTVDAALAPRNSRIVAFRRLAAADHPAIAGIPFDM